MTPGPSTPSTEGTSTPPTSTPPTSTRPTSTRPTSARPTSAPVISTRPTSAPVISTRPTSAPVISTRPTSAPVSASAADRRLLLQARRREAVSRFQEARLVAEQAAAATARTREMRLELQPPPGGPSHPAAGAGRPLRGAARPGRRAARPAAGRARVLPGLVVCTVSRLLTDRSVAVVAQVDNGAEAVGLAVAEQPDLVLVEDRVTMLPGEEVVRALREFCPETLVVAQASSGDRIGVLLDAGAQTVLGTQVRAEQVTDRLTELLLPA